MSIRTIVQKGNGRHSELLSTAVTIPPGSLIEMATAATVQKQSVAEAAGTYPEKMVAKENSLVGDEVSTVWAVSSQIGIYHAQSGDELYMMLEDGQNISALDFLTANGTNGTLITRGTDTNPPFAIALEDKDLSASANTADALILVRII